MTDKRNGNQDIYAQKVDSNGIVQWTANCAGVAVKNATQQNVQVVSDGAGGAIIVWEDSANGAFDIYAQRIDASGSLQWAANGIVICDAFTALSVEEFLPNTALAKEENMPPNTPTPLA